MFIILVSSEKNQNVQKPKKNITPKIINLIARFYLHNVIIKFPNRPNSKNNTPNQY